MKELYVTGQTNPKQINEVRSLGAVDEPQPIMAEPHKHRMLKDELSSVRLHM